MSAQPPTPVQQLVQGLRQLRLQGKSLQALEPGNQALARYPQEAPLVRELVRILVALGQGEMAARLLGTLGDTRDSGRGLEPEVGARLALLLGEEVRPGDGAAPDPEGWLARYLATGEDAFRAPGWQRMDMTVQGGPPDFFLDGSCAHCGHALRINLPVSLLVDRRELCPACFGGLRVHLGDLEEFLADQHGDLLELDTGDTDWDLLDTVRERTAPDRDVPEVIRNLGQEYQFLLNEILTGHLLAGRDPGTGKPS